MNRLTMVKLISRLRREPFAVSAVPVADDLGVTDGERMADLPRAQIPSRERDSTLIRAVVYAERPGRKRPRRLRMDLHVPTAPGPHPLVVYLPGGGFAMAQFRMGRAQRGYVADAGFVVASMVAYLRDHAAAYKVDASRVVLWGESAGVCGKSAEPRGKPALVHRFEGSAVPALQRVMTTASCRHVRV